ncbi:hypothetical protein ELQ87_21300 [Streptomyces griseoviridis]|uniref:Uncharacterized protein n=1 Tax=Streptomyces griseoviridis TaxID=45398 RepID=A0A3S9ZFG8_STRGD|nr:hypothetical protein ELQ87_21300 [Streptomyces griseoviridis]QCN86630.1 hypothetical protein DDJ31_17970 [Streptomyces griseoviridis]
MPTVSGDGADESCDGGGVAHRCVRTVGRRLKLRRAAVSVRVADFAVAIGYGCGNWGSWRRGWSNSVTLQVMPREPLAFIEQVGPAWRSPPAGS